MSRASAFCLDLLPIVNRTGLPPELSGLYGEDESDEEYSDEDDEDSNGTCKLCILTSCLDLMPPSAEAWYTNDYPEEEESDRDDDAGSGECIMSLSAG